MLLLLGRIFGIIVAGGEGFSRVDFFTGDLRIKNPPNLPKESLGSSMVAHNGTIFLCGGWGNLKKCLQLDYGTWKEHTTLNVERVYHSAVTTQTATFIFGGRNSRTTYEYLPKDSTEWLMGKTEIPGRGFSSGCAIAVKSGQEIWLIGGLGTEKRILSFNVNDHKFKVMPFQLNVGRSGHRCAFIPNTNKIMITGGYNDGFLDSTEVLDIEDGSVTMASPMNFKRQSHGIGVVAIDGKDRLAVLGGDDERKKLDSVELYTTHTEKWETSDYKLSKAKACFSFLNVKLGDILTNLN